MTFIRDYAADPSIIVRLNGVEFCKLPASEQEELREVNMADVIVMRTSHGLLTVNSRDAMRPVRRLSYANWQDEQIREEQLRNFERRFDGGYQSQRPQNSRYRR